jgi:hypothetical protein
LWAAEFFFFFFFFGGGGSPVAKFRQNTKNQNKKGIFYHNIFSEKKSSNLENSFLFFSSFGNFFTTFGLCSLLLLIFSLVRQKKRN